MKKVHFIARPAKVDKFSFEELWNEINYDWEGKAEQLQLRRWRQLRRQVNSGESSYN